MTWLLYILAQSADVAPSVANAIAVGGPVAILLAVAVGYFALRERKREKEDDERRKEDIANNKALIVALEQSTAAGIEVRRELEASRELRKETIRVLNMVLEKEKP